MKTISIITALFLFLSQAGFADTTDESTGCCQTSKETTAIQHQQLMQDQIQMETEEMRLHHSTISTQNVQNAVANRVEEVTSLNQIQNETENVSLESLQKLAQRAGQHVSYNANIAVK